MVHNAASETKMEKNSSEVIMKQENTHDTAV